MSDQEAVRGHELTVGRSELLHFRVGMLISVATGFDVRARFTRWWQRLLWFRYPPLVVTEMRFDRGSLVLDLARWSWLRWRWVARRRAS